MELKGDLRRHSVRVASSAQLVELSIWVSRASLPPEFASAEVCHGAAPAAEPDASLLIRDLDSGQMVSMATMVRNQDTGELIPERELEARVPAGVSPTLLRGPMQLPREPRALALTLEGEAVCGATLRVSASFKDASSHYSLWRRASAPAGGAAVVDVATGDGYSLNADDVGCCIEVVVTPFNEATGLVGDPLTCRSQPVQYDAQSYSQLQGFLQRAEAEFSVAAVPAPRITTGLPQLLPNGAVAAGRLRHANAVEPPGEPCRLQIAKGVLSVREEKSGGLGKAGAVLKGSRFRTMIGQQAASLLKLEPEPYSGHGRGFCLYPPDGGAPLHLSATSNQQRDLIKLAVHCFAEAAVHGGCEAGDPRLVGRLMLEQRGAAHVGATLIARPPFVVRGASVQLRCPIIIATPLLIIDLTRSTH